MIKAKKQKPPQVHSGQAAATEQQPQVACVSVIICPNPFNPSARLIEAMNSTETIAGWLDRNQQRVGLVNTAFIAIINEKAVLRKDWKARRVEQGETLAFVVLPAGGGGGGKNPLATVASLALFIGAPYLAPSVSGALGLSGGLATKLVTAGIALGGSLLIGALFPPPAPRLREFGNTPAPSPTYSLNARGNQARLGQPIPAIYGSHKIYPDLAAAPWTSYSGNEQYLHQLHMIGHGEYDINAISIDDTPIANFTEITHQIIRPGGDITLFEPDYVTAPEVSGQEMRYGGSLNRSRFVINPPNTITTELQVDVVLPGGLYKAGNDGSLLEWTVHWNLYSRKIDDDGVEVEEEKLLAHETLTESTNTPIRRTYIYTVERGRYELRMARSMPHSTDIRVRDVTRWEAARARLGRTTNTTGVTMLAIRARATDNLSQRNRGLVSCLVSRKLPIWDGTVWSDATATRSIAWALADIARSRYGGKFVDQRIDLAALLVLDRVWSDRNDRFDAVFDASTTVWEALNRAARCGRAGCYLQGGVLRIVRDQQQELAVAMFTPRNIVKGSLKIDYRLSDENTATAVKVQFHNRRSWVNDSTTQSLDSDNSDPAMVTLFGITDEAHARREALYIARANRYRRKAVTFTTELEGLIPTYGDLIRIIHQQPSWGVGGEVVEWDVGTKTATLSESPDWGDKSTGYLVLRNATGGIAGSWQVMRGSAENQVILPDDAAPRISLVGEREASQYGFALSATEVGIEARVVGIKPRGRHQIEITALAEDSRVHDE